jgi:hypothetical protein
MATRSDEQPAALDGAQCAVHSREPASIICSRCGCFACTACIAPDGARCARCSGRPQRVKWAATLALSAGHAMTLWLFLQLQLLNQTIVIDACQAPQLVFVPRWLQVIIFDWSFRVAVPAGVALFFMLDNVLADRRGGRAWGVQSRGLEFGAACTLCVVGLFFLAERLMNGDRSPNLVLSFTPAVLTMVVACSVAANRGAHWARLGCRVLPFLVGVAVFVVWWLSGLEVRELVGLTLFMVGAAAGLLAVTAAVERVSRRELRVTGQLASMLVWLCVAVLQFLLHARLFSLACRGPPLSAFGPAALVILVAFVAASVLRITQRHRWPW